MKASKFSETHIVSILKSQNSDKTVEVICREHGIAPASFYTWKKNMAVWKAKNLNECESGPPPRLEAENTRLKKLLADKSLDYDILKEGYAILKKM